MGMYGMAGLAGVGGLAWGGLSYVQKVLSTGPYAFWTHADTSGTVIASLIHSNQNGVNHGGFTLNQPSLAGDGLPSVWYDGIDGYGDLFSAALAAAFNYDEGSYLTWFQVPEGFWVEEANHTAHIFGANTTNYVQLELFAAGSVRNISVRRKANGNAASTSFVNPQNQSWAYLPIPIVGTWSLANDRVRGYAFGTPFATPATGLQTWTGGAITTAMVARRLNEYANIWKQHTVLWSRELTPTEAAYVSIV